MSLSKTFTCPHCGYEDSGKYCSKCGYKLEKKRLTVSNLFAATVDFFYNLEIKKFIFTCKSLTFRPIPFIKGFINGERRNCYPPIKFMLLNAGINLFVYNMFKIDKIDLDQEDSALELMDSLPQSDIMFNNIVDNYGQFLTIFMIPLFVLASMVVHKKSSYNAPERATAIMYLFGQFVLVQIFLNLIGGIFNPFLIFRSYISAGLGIFIVVLLNLKFFKENLVNTIWKSIAIILFVFGGMVGLLYVINIILQYYFD
ncbi:MAG: DUF3667 domain-containing protein [Saprospiraceae bacterium]|nr:DUF3667 domain-containing protein [Candidatus Defluviibacterium haderslevense]